MKTKQEIIDSLATVGQEVAELHRKERAAIEEKVHAIRAQCGESGHVWAKSGDLMALLLTCRVCVVCGEHEHQPAPVLGEGAPVAKAH
jgi:hypothetical protein